MASPCVRTITSDASIASKEDSPLKLSTWGETTLAQVDKCFVELPLEGFKSLLPGADLPDAQLIALPKFEFLKTLTKEDQKYDPLCDTLNAVEKLADTSNRWKNIAFIPEDSHSDHRPDIGSYCEDIEGVVTAFRDGVRPLKRKRSKSRREGSRTAVRSKRPRVETADFCSRPKHDATKAEDDLGGSRSSPDPDSDSDSDYEGSDVEVAPDAYRARTAWGWLVSFVEVKDDESVSGFHFKPKHDSQGKSLLLRDGDKPKAARAQFVKYFTEAMLRQHRTHYYAFYIAENWVRVFRWDRIGCIVSPPINLDKDPGVFHNILYRIARWNAWGFDDTAVLANDEDIQKLAEYSNLNEYFQQYRNLMLDYRAFYPIYKVSCPVVSMDGAKKSSKASKFYLIGRAISAHYSPVGRCTRGYVAFDLEDRKLVFFKDQWRCVGRTRTELETYKRLHKHNVSNIALPVAGGDIPHHLTLTQEYLTHIPAKERHSQRIHTRLVTQQVGLMLETYKDSPELLLIIGHANIAHCEAWELAGVLHRDVSVGNVMIDAATGEGFLNDWDLAKWREDMQNLVPASEPAGISGTIPFKSALSLQFPRKPPEVADDVESFIHLAAYMGMRFHWHEFSPKDNKVPADKEQRNKFNNENSRLVNVVNNFFFQDNVDAANSFAVGGEMKLLLIKQNKLPIKFRPYRGKRPLIEEFLIRAWNLLNRHYSQLNFDDYAAYKVDETCSTRPDEADLPEPEAREFNASKLFKFRRNARSRLHRQPEVVDPSPQAAPARQPAGPRTGLDHHDLNDILCELFCDDDGNQKDMSEYYGDKAFDHFVHQGIITYSPRKNYSGVRLSADNAPVARSKWSREREAFFSHGRKNPASLEGSPRSPSDKEKSGPQDSIDDSGHHTENPAEDDVPPRRRTRSATKAQASTNAPLAALADPSERVHGRGKASAVRKRMAAPASKVEVSAAPTRRTVRKSTPPKNAAPAKKSATKASTSRKAQALRVPTSPRKAAPVAKAKITDSRTRARNTKGSGKSAGSSGKGEAPVKAGRAAKGTSPRAQVPSNAPVRRSSRLAQQGIK